jgi:hypothetical protein
MAASPIYVGTLKTPVVTLTTAHSTASFVDVWTPSTGSGGKLESICITQDSTAGRTLQWAVSTGSASYLIGETAITSGAGTDGATKATDALNATDFPWIRSDGVNRYFMLQGGYKLQVRPRTALDAGKVLNIVGQGGDF